MKEKDLHKIIRDNGARDDTLLVNALKANHPELTASKPRGTQDRRNRTYKRLTAVFTALSAAQVLALILIPSLLLSGGKSSLQTGAGTKPSDGIWNSHAQSVHYIDTKTNCSIDEYNEAHDTNFLFFSTVQYDYNIREYRGLTDEYLCLQVELTCDDNDERISYVVCTKDAALDITSYDISVCTNVSVLSDCPVKWGTTADGSVCGIFSYDNYDYYISVSGNSARLFELVQELLDDRR
ncbi:MAG: hypothetical protein K2I75_05180 [Clostridiales bacterium]|nr:hypothetical protein [Clostridiales bacterium]